MCLWVVEEVGPVGVGLHVPELKQLPEAQHQDVVTDLRQKQTNTSNHFHFSCFVTLGRLLRTV